MRLKNTVRHHGIFPDGFGRYAAAGNHWIPLLLSTSNKGKISEIKDLLKNFPVRIKDLDAFDPVAPPVEDGSNFTENACKKARYYADYYQIPALADDSGLVVEALGGMPGIHSARYAGIDATDTDRCIKLLREMTGVADRKAYFQCVVCIAIPNGPVKTYSGRCEGRIAETMQGDNGFGYDPIFYCPSMKKTFAQLSRQEKGAVSHRGNALKMLQQDFDEVLMWMHRNWTGKQPSCSKR